jgi:hypothetical protein
VFSKIASGKAAILWIECDAWPDAHQLKANGDLGDLIVGGAGRIARGFPQGDSAITPFGS